MKTNQSIKSLLAAIALSIGFTSTNAATITLTINGEGETHKVSPYVYGKNNSTSDEPSKATTEAEWTQILPTNSTAQNTLWVSTIERKGWNISTK